MRPLGVLLLVFATAGWAEAGELVFRDGKQLAADLAGQVILISTGSDVVELSSEEVALLTADEVRLKDGRVIRGTVVGGSLRTRTEYGELAVRIEDVQLFRAAEDRPQASAPPPAAPAPPAPATAAVAAAPSTPSGPIQVAEGAGRIGQGFGETARGVGRTISDGADRLHDGFKAAGVAIWEGVKSVGRAVEEAVTRPGR